MKMVGGDNVFALARSCLGLRRRCGGGLPERWTGLWVWLGRDTPQQPTNNYAIATASESHFVLNSSDAISDCGHTTSHSPQQ